MDSVDKNSKPDMKHMEYEEDLSPTNKGETNLQDEIYIDQKLESRIKYAIHIALTPLVTSVC